MYQEPRDMRRAAKRAYKADKYRYGRQRGGIFSLLVLIVCLAFYLLTHAWAWIMVGIIGIAVLIILVLLLRPRQFGARDAYYQQPYQQSQTPPQDYQPYQEGYQPPRQYPPQYNPPTQGYQDYERPRAQYPDQPDQPMPPMQ